ncbi:MAG: helix-turn-helix domain-containing protein [Candidatus Paracaedibacteraceae bacterium]|nr:helix-turn-helix domain-containing protein [Candidatus Paracaedibacteraceae bacterium]
MDNQIAERLRSRIKSANLTPTDLERRAGLALASVRNILNGRSKNPTIETMRAIANTLGCTVDDLITEKETLVATTEKLQQDEHHQWLKPLLLESIDFVDSYLENKKHPFSFEEAMFLVKEIYTFSLGTKDRSVDKRFAEWLINKNI